MTTIERRDNTLIVSRTFDAPRERVFEAWTNPGIVEQWWGCAQATRIRTTIDLRVGGVFRNVMTMGDCGVYDMKCVFTIVDPPRTLAYRADDPHPTETIVEFIEAEGGRTLVRMTISGLPDGLTDIVTAGTRESLDKLDRVVA